MDVFSGAPPGKAQVIEELHDAHPGILATHGLPDKTVTGNRLTFNSDFFNEFMEEKLDLSNLHYPLSCCFQYWIPTFPISYCITILLLTQIQKAPLQRCYRDGGQDHLQPEVRTRVVRSQEEQKARCNHMLKRDCLSQGTVCMLNICHRFILVARLHVVG